MQWVFVWYSAKIHNIFVLSSNVLYTPVIEPRIKILKFLDIVFTFLSLSFIVTLYDESSC